MHLDITTCMLKGFVDGNFEWNLYTFLKPNQEQLRKIQLYQPQAAKPAALRFPVERSNQLSYSY